MSDNYFRIFVEDDQGQEVEITGEIKSFEEARGLSQNKFDVVWEMASKFKNNLFVKLPVFIEVFLDYITG